ncbi:Rieske 2Fe-2S domain-containing protein [Nocardia sp. R6R-6]|uniref:Rieske 2Fe-2S domain-containing protein n=1 Tax=Nocardia sp. R6R-6 TaxID=3459303 RepID=UPI00403D980C
MGELFRRFWLPAVTSAELSEPDSPPVRLKILGEHLVAFRDSSGKVGIVSAYCSHRLAPLFFGRNEECGLRCAYHGWKFDVDGNCLETPNVEVGAPDIRSRVGITAYPTEERAGVVWIYMGPADKRPPLPGMEYANLPGEQVYAARWLQRTNWSQGLEGEIDSSHISWLHRDFDRGNSRQKAAGSQMSADAAPYIELRETEYGLVYGARRSLDDGTYQWRVTQFIAPMFSLIPRAPGEFTQGGGRAWVPIDDNLTTVFTFGYHVDGPIPESEHRDYYGSGALFPPRMSKGAFVCSDDYIIDTFVPLATKENDYLVDREMQRTQNFTGIWGVHDQDRALAENSRALAGNTGIADRTHEHLVSSDRAVVAARRFLLNMADKLAGGEEPEIIRRGDELFRVRAISRVTPIDNFDEFVDAFGGELTPGLAGAHVGP